MFAGVDVAFDSAEPSKLSALGVPNESSHDKFTSSGTLIQVKRQLTDRIVDDSAVRARPIAFFKWGNVCAPVAGMGEIEQNVALLNAIVRDAVVKGASIPRKVDELNSSGDKHGAMRVHKGPKLIRHRNTDERKKGCPLHTAFECLRENVSSLELRFNIIKLNIRSG
eukprot:GHVR01145257.1.p2 GENE.GHVR01145257.1~~GHVR01145257.1.p2  ORF type:complete len:167 (-),score=10.11 GHVR01145257.1:955-1455(-)